ncbi:MAG: arginine deiminase family protein [Candidatus Woesearchaeota archaeon]
MFKYAIVRKPSINFHKGITTSNLGKPNYKKTLKQHFNYYEALLKCGLKLIVLDADDKFPDSCFVEDTAIILNKIAIITKLKYKSRQGEEKEIQKILSKYKTIKKIKEKGTIEGGDVVKFNKHFFIGRSKRTNLNGSKQLSNILEKYNYSSSEIKVKKQPHLDSGVSYIGYNNFICIKNYSNYFKDSNVLIVNDNQDYYANCLFINDFLLIAKGFKDKIKFKNMNYKTIELDMSEFRKMDGSLSCLSLLF